MDNESSPDFTIVKVIRVRNRCWLRFPWILLLLLLRLPLRSNFASHPPGSSSSSQVEAKNNQGVLLAVVQVLADLNLVINKANISFDGEWSMDGGSSPTSSSTSSMIYNFSLRIPVTGPLI